MKDFPAIPATNTSGSFLDTESTEHMICSLVTRKAEASKRSGHPMSPLDIAMMTLHLQKVMAGEHVHQSPQEEALEKTWKGERAPGDPFCAPEDSVHPDYIICLENGRQLSMLKRHLKETHGMTPDEYRAKWNLPDDYPMTAPNYTASKAKAARARGLGRHKRSEPVSSLVGA